MAKSRRKYSRGAGTEVKREMHRYKRGSAKSGRADNANDGVASLTARRLVQFGKYFIERST
jgi:hypothetical protein